jgi:hypothetical protein
MQERFDYAEFGAVHAAFLLGRLLVRPVGFGPSSSLGWQDIWNRNIIFLGNPTQNPAIRDTLVGPGGAPLVQDTACAVTDGAAAKAFGAVRVRSIGANASR